MSRLPSISDCDYDDRDDGDDVDDDVDDDGDDDDVDDDDDVSCVIRQVMIVLRNWIASWI